MFSSPVVVVTYKYFADLLSTPFPGRESSLIREVNGVYQLDVAELLYAGSAALKWSDISTAVESTWLLDRLEECRARRQVLILDCCQGTPCHSPHAYSARTAGCAPAN